MLVAALDGPPRYRPRSLGDDAFALARACYDHLAGRLGVALADALIRCEHLVLDDEGGTMTPQGAAFLAGFGVDLAPSTRRRARLFCRPCLDWTERRPHLAGTLGARLAGRCFELGWIERMRDSRTVKIMGPGHDGLRAIFGIELAGIAPDRLVTT